MTFEYNDGSTDLPKDAFRISPSGVSRFFTHTNQWWRENLLGEGGFQGNTSSYLGTIVHECLNAYANGEEIDVDYVTAHIDSLEDLDDVDITEIHKNWRAMVEAGVNGFVATHPMEKAEDFIYKETLPGIYPSGSFDYYEQGTVSDFKTYGGLSAPTTISFAYRVQLLTYAWLLQQNGVPVDRIRVVFITRNQVNRVSEKTGKPLKDYPSTCTTITECITQDDMEYIEGIINLVGESVIEWRNNPSVRHLLAQDYRLKV